MKQQDQDHELDIPIYYSLKVVLLFGPEVPLKIRERVQEEFDAFMHKKITPICYNLDWKIV
jgi:hypothetical protein